MHRLIALLIGSLLASCTGTMTQGDFQDVEGTWERGEVVSFQIKETDSTTAYDMYLYTRVNPDYGYNNLHMITTLAYPNGKTQVDTLEYRMAFPNGKLMGTGVGSTKESKLVYLEGVRFRESGTYLLEVRQAMRNTGEIQAIESLDGVEQIGYSLEKKLNNG